MAQKGGKEERIKLKLKINRSLKKGNYIGQCCQECDWLGVKAPLWSLSGEAFSVFPR